MVLWIADEGFVISLRSITKSNSAMTYCKIKEYYQGENMKLIMKDLRELMKNKKILMNYNGIKQEFNINKIGLFVCDTLNQHMFYYRFCARYFDEHNINKEELIPLEIREQFYKDAYIIGTQEGKTWFENNLEAIQLFSDEKKLTKDFEISDEITTIFEETETTPQLDYICYDIWYKHPRYNEIKEALNELRKMEDSIVDRCYDYEATYFYERLDKRGETPKYKNLFVQQSKKYLMDETIPAVILNNNRKPSNYFDFYYFGKLPHHLAIYNGKKARNSDFIQKHIKNALKGIDDCCQVFLRT